MSLADELLKLEELRNRGTLNEAEFQQAKAKLLEAEAEAQPSNLDEQNITEQLAELQIQAKLAQIDRAWEFERQNYLVSSKYGNQIPTRGSAIGGIVASFLIAVVGLALCIATWDTPGKKSGGIFLLLLIPAFIGIVLSGQVLQKAKAYEKAYRYYQLRRIKASQGPAFFESAEKNAS